MINKFDESKCYDYENGFYLTSEVFRIGNVLSHYEIYKKILELPGDIIELGVFKGSSLIQFCSFRELLENEKARKIVGFDTFDSFPKSDGLESDMKFVSSWNEAFGDELISREEIYKSLQLKNISNVELVKGDIRKTLSDYLNRNPYTKISLLHIDTVVYEPSKLGLELLYDRIVKGGIILLDDYGTAEGETLAADEFFEGRDYEIHKFRFSHTKPSYIIKK